MSKSRLNRKNATDLHRVVVSYLISSTIILLGYLLFQRYGVFEYDFISAVSNEASVELRKLAQLSFVLISNFILHVTFYYGRFTASPLVRGVSIGFLMGLSIFILSVFESGCMGLISSPLNEIVSIMATKAIEFTSCGVLTAILSVSEIPRWGLFKAL